MSMDKDSHTQQNTDRRILHCDLNSFYANVELLSYPELADKPVAVCGNPKNRHGIILAKNEAAKKYLIKTAETVFQARKKCPDLILLPPHHDEYQRYSKIINRIYYRFSNYVEPFSIDESWLDISDSYRRFGKTPTDVAHLVRETVKNETKLTISVGLSYNKIFSKLGSDYKKPDAVTVITPDNYKSILWPLPIRDLTFVGRRAGEKLKGFGIRSIGDLANFNRDLLVMEMGKSGGMLHDYANGFDDRPVREFTRPRNVKSIGNGNTFAKDLHNMEEVHTNIRPLCRKVSQRLQEKHLNCGAVAVMIKDSDFKSISRQMPLPVPTNDGRVLFEKAVELVDNHWSFKIGIRMLTVTALKLSDTEDEKPIQVSLFDIPKQNQEREITKLLEELHRSFDKVPIDTAEQLLKSKK